MQHFRRLTAAAGLSLATLLVAAEGTSAQSRTAAAGVVRPPAPTTVHAVRAFGSEPSLRVRSGMGQHIAQGVAIGALVGVVVGGVAGYHSSETCDQKSDPSFCHALLAFGGGVLGFASGAVIGGVGGYIYHVATRPRPSGA